MTPEELADLLEARILGPGRLRADEVVGAGGASLEDATELWTSLGFPPVDPDEAAFTDADAENLANAMGFRLLGYDADAAIIPMTRVLGQALSRVATAQAQAFHDGLVEIAHEGDGSDEASAGDIDVIVDLLVPSFESFVSYVWRRHLVAAIRRDLLGTGMDQVVGFGDLVGFTRETRDLGDAELSDLLGRFQRVATEQVTASGARIIKGLGDGVLFAAGSPEVAARAALGLVGACDEDDVLPSVRVGLAHGHVVELEGDLYGETVNRASRLADVARPSSVLADPELGSLLRQDDAFLTKRTQPYKLKGLGEVRTVVVRWAPEPDGD